MGVNSLPKTVTRQRRGCDLNPGPYAPSESSTLTTRATLGLGWVVKTQTMAISDLDGTGTAGMQDERQRTGTGQCTGQNGGKSNLKGQRIN